MFKYLLDLGNHVGLFYKELKARGRPPSGYAQLDLSNPEQLAVAILKTRPKKKQYDLALNQSDIAHTFRSKQPQDFE